MPVRSEGSAHTVPDAALDAARERLEGKCVRIPNEKSDAKVTRVYRHGTRLLAELRIESDPDNRDHNAVPIELLVIIESPITDSPRVPHSKPKRPARKSTLKKAA